MHLRRAAQAIGWIFSRPQEIQIGNSIRNFSAANRPGVHTGLYKNFVKKNAADSSLAKFIDASAMRAFLCRVMLWLVAFMLMPNSAQADLKDVTIIPKINTAGVGTSYLISFKGDSSFKRIDKIHLYFSRAIDFSGILAAINVKNLDGGFRVLRFDSDSLIVVERDGHGVDLVPGDTGSFRIAIVGNPVQPGTYTIKIQTYRGNSGNFIEGGTGKITINAGPLNHFIFSNLANPVAGINFPFTITAKDAYNNNVVLSDSVFLSDNTATLTPKNVVMNTQSSLTINNARITKGQPGVVITARAKMSGKIGASNAFNVNQIKILSVETATDKVSRGQTNIEVNMLVQNVGPEAITLTDAQLSFKRINPGDENNSYTVTRTSPLSIITGASVKTFKFSVTVDADAKFDSVEINGSVNGSVSGGGIVNDNDADAKDSWIVQRPPALSYVSSPGLAPKEVSAGSFYEFQVPLQNTGEAKLDLKPDSTTIMFNDASGDTFQARLDANRGVSISGGGNATLTFRRNQIPLNLQQNTYGPKIKLIGTHNGVRFEQTVTLNDTLEVKAAPPLQIQNIFASQDTVTRGMSKLWTITVVVKNNTPAPANLKSAELSLVKFGAGGGPDASYQISQPDTFKRSGDGRLKDGKIDSLVFQITKTGLTTGMLAVFARVFVNELSEPAESNGTQESILAQTPAKLSVTLRASQDKVTQNQTQPWQVIMKVKNDGESAAQAIFINNLDPTKITRTSLSSEGSDYRVDPVTPGMITGQSSTDIFFDVTKTGAQPGNVEVFGQVFAQEINSDSLHSTTTPGILQILVQPPDSVAIASVELDEVFNRDLFSPVGSKVDTVNSRQVFNVKVAIKQTIVGAEKVDSVRVRLTKGTPSDPLSIANNLLTLTDLSRFLFFKVTIGATAAKQMQLRAQVESAYSANTRANTVKFNSLRRNVNVYTQTPGSLSLDSLRASETKVRFGRTQPWYINLFVKNPGPQQEGGAVIIDSTRISFTVNGVAQNDYTIQKIKPTGPADTIYAGSKDTLVYKVTKTGIAGGTARIKSTIFFYDKNSRQRNSFSDSTMIFIESTPFLTIAKTSFPSTVNRVAGTEIALVDTGQVFPINVAVRNTGLEKVDQVWVTLSTQGRSKIQNEQKLIGPIDTETGIAIATFMVRAGADTNRIGEIFTARIDSAKTLIGTPVSIGQALDGRDTTAVVRLELPARLQLSLVAGDGSTSLTRNQQFKVRARVKNLGQAQTDKSGILKIIPPGGYDLVNNDPTKNFAAGDSVEWNIKAHSQESQLDTFIVTMTPPKNKNSGQPADMANNAARLTVNTFENALNISAKFIVAPDGAKDGIISTDQIFTVRVRINASSNLTPKTVTLKLPAGSGYRFVNGDSATKNATGDTARWQVQAPSIENLKPVKLPIAANAFAGQAAVSDLDTLVIQSVEKQAILQLEPGIGTGAQNSVVSINQNFTIVARLRNTGRAFANGTVEVAINAPSGILQAQEPLRKTAVFTSGINIKEVTWQARAPGRQSSDTLTFTITQRPRDVNSGLEVFTSNDPAEFVVTTVTTGIVSAGQPFISAPVGGQDLILSTGQNFIVSDTLRWFNAASLSAELVLPASFTVFNRIQNIPNPNETGKVEVSWIVRAPVGAISNVDCRVLLKAKDAHDAAVSLENTSTALQFNVVQRAELSLRAEITEPPSAVDRVVGVGQPFTVVARIFNAGAAKLDSAAEVSLEFPRNTDYQLLDSQDSCRVIAFPDQNTCSWRVQARTSITAITDLLTLRLKKPPFDENTNTLAAINDAETELAVRTEGRKLIVAAADKGGGPAVRGQQNVLLLRLQLNNPAGPTSSNLMLKMLDFDLRNRGGEPVLPRTALKAVRVSNNSGTIVGSIADIPLNSQSLQVTLNATIAIDKPDTVSIFADLADDAAQTFRLVFDDSDDFAVADQDGGYGAVVETIDGKSGPQFRLESNLTAIHGAEASSSFFNYPNPFQPGNNQSNNEGTRFSLPAGASGELKIFTLLGELVWETQIDLRNLSGPIFWNGHNGMDKRVLNGVYVAMLKTKDGKTLTTKVAVLKK